MKILDRYVLVEWFKAFIATICVTLGILILHDMYNNLSDLLEYGAGSQILLYYCLLTPSLVPVILPISLLISVIFVLGNFHKNNEITAMRASGMNVFRITRSLWFAGFLLAGFLFWLNAQLVPYSIEKSRLLLNNLEYSNQRANAKGDEIIGEISNICFSNKVDGRLWFISKYSQASNQAFGVEVHIFDKAGSESQKILAKEGVYDEVKSSWFFADGQKIELDGKGSAVKSETFKKLVCDDFNENPQIMKLSMSRARDLSLNELKALIEASGGADSEAMRPYAVKLSSIWASPFACVIVVAIAIPFSIAGVRTNPMVGVSKTAGLFFGYYILDSIFSSFGGSGLLPITLAAWIPNVLMLIFALSLYRKYI